MDVTQAGTKPNCRVAQTDIKNDAWCKASPVLLPLRKQRIIAALNRMNALGGECSVIAAKGLAMLDGSLRVYDPGPTIAYDGWGFGDNGGFLLLRSTWTDEYIETGSASYKTKLNGVPVTVKAGLQWVLAHEIEHVLSRGHIDPKSEGGAAALTQNAIACGG